MAFEREKLYTNRLQTQMCIAAPSENKEESGEVLYTTTSYTSCEVERVLLQCLKKRNNRERSNTLYGRQGVKTAFLGMGGNTLYGKSGSKTGFWTDLAIHFMAPATEIERFCTGKQYSAIAKDLRKNIHKQFT